MGRQFFITSALSILILLSACAVSDSSKGEENVRYQVYRLDNSPRVGGYHRSAGWDDAGYALTESRSDIPWRGLVVYDLNEPAFDAGAMATKAARTFLGCEVRAWIAVMGNIPKDAVGYAAGERGGPQIHPSWRQKMAGMGLNFEVERDRWVFAIWLAEVSGWQNWAYCQHTVQGADGTSGEW